MLMLTSAEVEDLIDLGSAREYLGQVFREQAEGQVVPWAPSLMRAGGAPFILRSGGLIAEQRMGVRVTTGPQNPSYALIYDAKSGHILCFMAYPFSDLRLDATVALGVDCLARPESKRVAMIGTGRLALGLLEGVASVRQIGEIAAYSRSADNRSRFAERASAALNLPVSAAPTAEDAVRGADIVLVCTNSEVPALRGAWLEPNAHVVAAGLRTEIHPDVFERADLIVTTSKVQEMNIHDVDDSWPLIQLMNAAKLDWDAVAELGDVVAGRATRPPGISVLREAQGGFGDIALASLAYQRACELGRGNEVAIS